MENHAQKGNVIIILAITILALAGIFAFLQTKPRSFSVVDANPTIPPQIVTPSNSIIDKNFTSKNLNFSISYPSFLIIKDNEISTELSSEAGVITIVKNGTNFDTLEDYINEFDSKRKSTSSDVKKLTINNFDAVHRTIKFLGDNTSQKSYYIYANNSVYILSTSSEALYGDLDKIAKSFKYSP